MEQIKNKLKNREFQKETKPSNWWLEMGKELTAHFRRNCFWLPYRYEQWKIRQAFKESQTRGKDFRYFLGILNKP